MNSTVKEILQREANQLHERIQQSKDAVVEAEFQLKEAKTTLSIRESRLKDIEEALL